MWKWENFLCEQWYFNFSACMSTWTHTHTHSWYSYIVYICSISSTSKAWIAADPICFLVYTQFTWKKNEVYGLFIYIEYVSLAQKYVNVWIHINLRCGGKHMYSMVNKKNSFTNNWCQCVFTYWNKYRENKFLKDVSTWRNKLVHV